MSDGKITTQELSSELKDKLGDLESHLAESAKKHIAESGSNANGSYIKFDDGTQIAYGRKQSVELTTSQVGSIYRAGLPMITFPTTFIQPPYCDITIENRVFWGDIDAISISSCNPIAWSGSLQESIKINYGFLAIGRWK